VDDSEVGVLHSNLRVIYLNEVGTVDGENFFSFRPINSNHPALNIQTKKIDWKFEKRQGALVFFSIFWAGIFLGIFIFQRLDLIKGH